MSYWVVVYLSGAVLVALVAALWVAGSTYAAQASPDEVSRTLRQCVTLYLLAIVISCLWPIVLALAAIRSRSTGAAPAAPADCGTGC